VHRIVVVTGTGTEIGKTFVADALLRSFPRGVRVVGYKPIESGVTGDEGEDGRRLRLASTFHVKHPALEYLFRRPVSPHLAAREELLTIAIDAVASACRALATEADVVVVELAGGLFSPVTDRALNADIARQLPEAACLLVAPDRLGVLHDVVATVGAATARALSIGGIVLSAPSTADASTGTNAAELPRFTSVPILASLPRASVDHVVAAGLLAPVVAHVMAR
jgi:dethiobiotin synthetase